MIRLKRRSEEAGIAPCSPRDLRRIFVSDLLEAGTDIAIVQRLAGHASPLTTAHYDRRETKPCNGRRSGCASIGQSERLLSATAWTRHRRLRDDVLPLYCSTVALRSTTRMSDECAQLSETWVRLERDAQGKRKILTGDCLSEDHPVIFVPWWPPFVWESPPIDKKCRTCEHSAAPDHQVSRLS